MHRERVCNNRTYIRAIHFHLIGFKPGLLYVKGYAIYL
jgi:hypothetical protein